MLYICKTLYKALLLYIYGFVYMSIYHVIYLTALTYCNLNLTSKSTLQIILLACISSCLRHKVIFSVNI